MGRETDIRDTLIRDARGVVADTIEYGLPLTGACIVSSLAAGDFTPVSDVDMLFVAADDDERPGIFRRLAGDRVIEWVVLPRDYLKDVDSILSDAGLSHDILTAIILRDEDGWLGQVQRTVADNYKEPRWIRTRAAGQLQRTARAIEAMQRHLAEGNVLTAQRAHVSVLKGLFGLPRAVANKRCTMARGLLFCREATTELGWFEYMAGVLSVFCAGDVTRDAVVELQDIAHQIIAATGFTENEKAIRRWFLGSSNWLLNNAQPADAVWPLYFWSSTTVEEAGGEQNAAVWNIWLKFAQVLGVAETQDLAQRNAMGRRVYELATKLIMQ